MQVKTVKFPAAVLFLLLTAVSYSPAGPVGRDDSLPFLDLKIAIDPQYHIITARAEWSGLAEAGEHLFYLNRLMRLDSVKIGGNPAHYKFDLEGESAPFSPVSRRLTVLGSGRQVEIVYSGCLPDTISMVNMVAPQLVELAMYSGYYPFNLGEIPLFDYRLEFTIPDSFMVVTSGEETERTTRRGRTTRVIRSSAAGMDVPVVASPLLVCQKGGSEKIGVEVYSSAAAGEIAAGKIASLTRAMVSYEQRFGKSSSSGRLRFVLSPRDGWGYSRLPLAVVSEGRELRLANEPFGLQSSLQGAVHETAHFWWLTAPTTKLDDWINEALAEYSAFSFMAAEFGPEYRDHCLCGYLEDIRKASTPNSIMTTRMDSPDSYVNKYEKPAVLFYVLSRRAGQEVVDTFLAALNTRFKGTREATTQAFLEMARGHFKAEDFEFMKSFLDSPGWSREQIEVLAVQGGFSSLL